MTQFPQPRSERGRSSPLPSAVASLLLLISAALLLATGSPRAEEAAQAKPLIFGVLPYASPTLIEKQHGPLAERITELVGRPVRIETAPGYRTFLERGLEGRYDIMLSAPHFSAFLRAEAAYTMIGVVDERMEAAVYVRGDSECRKLEDLRGKQIAAPERFSLPAIELKDALRDIDAAPDMKPEVVHFKTYGQALLALINGEVEASVSIGHLAQLLPADLIENLRIIHQFTQLPSGIFLAGERLTSTEQRAIRNLILDFGGPITNPGPFATPQRTNFRYRALLPAEREELMRYQGMVAQQFEALVGAPRTAPSPQQR
jgi:phosphonate transport system substrate-binding protein